MDKWYKPVGIIMSNIPAHHATTPLDYPIVGWFNALTVDECLKEIRNKPPALTQNDIDRAKRYLENWKARTPFVGNDLFSLRLASAGLTEPEFLTILATSAEHLYQSCAAPPVWMVELNRLVAGDANNLEGWTANHKAAEMTQALLAPLLSTYAKRLRLGLELLLEDQDVPPFQQEVVAKKLQNQVFYQLCQMVQRTLALELQVAGQEGLVSGDSPTDRTRMFLKRLRQPSERLALLNEYSVLSRQCLQRLDLWLESNLEFLQRLIRDREALSQTFTGGQDIGSLVDIEIKGDKHRHGRAVTAVRFDSGFRLIYKPRPVGIENRFQKVMAWLNRHGQEPALEGLDILDRDGYGWVKFVCPQKCSSQIEVENFFRRQGSWLAVLYALAGTDMHLENLIAAASQPVLVDLETLFQPSMESPPSDSADALARQYLVNSVLTTGLLPLGGAKGYDTSGLTGNENQLLPQTVPELRGGEDDDLHIIRRQGRLNQANNVVILEGQTVDYRSWGSAIETGFRATYRLLLEHRDDWCSPNGLLSLFASEQIRLILRNTMRYMTVLSDSWHPDFLRLGLAREQLFDHLWTEAAWYPSLSPCIGSEVRQLLNGDIPYFTSTVDSCDLRGGDGTAIPGVLARSGLEVVQSRFQSLGEQDLELQTWFLRQSLALAGHDQRFSPCFQGMDMVQMIAWFGKYLSSTVIRAGDTVSWLTLALEDNGSSEDSVGFSFSNVDLDLYEGLPGIVLFLAYFDAVMPATAKDCAAQRQSSMRALAAAALETIHRRVEDLDASSWPRFGAFTGWGGLIYLWSHLGYLWQRDDLLDRAEAAFEHLEHLMGQDNDVWDIVAGSAGCILSLLSLHQVRPESRSLELGVRCGENLLAASSARQPGRAWDKLPFQRGFSHGPAGVAWALERLADATGDNRYLEAAAEALSWEDHLISHGLEDKRPGLHAWCHGGAGLALSRLAVYRKTQEQAFLASAESALEITSTQPIPANHSLCHGTLGNLDCLRLACTLHPEGEAWLQQLQNQTISVIDDLQQRGWRTSLPGNAESRGLMLGLSGIGYGLLRLYNPSFVPSVLTLQPPGIKNEFNSFRPNATRL